MRKILALTACMLLGTAPAIADSNPQMDPKMMEAFTKASTPGEEHKLLQQYAGKWDHEVKWWMKPGDEPEVSKGTSEIEPIMGGRFILQKVAGTSMGQPFEGMGITGYDNVQKHFSSVWLDNMGTGMMGGKGTFDKASNSIIDKGSFSCPLEKDGSKSYRAVWGPIADNSFKYEMFSTDESGKEFRMMEITYKKAS